jgi:phage tail sheath protein FI
LKFVNAPENLRIKDTGTLNDKFAIEWDYEVENDQLLFVLEESVSPTFEFPQIIFQNKRKRFEVSDHGAGIFYYRVRAEIGGVTSDWSEGLAIRIPAAENWRVKLLDKNELEAPERHYSSDVLVAVQRALLRMCAARGDIFAVLDLPEHFEKDDALRYIAALKATKGQTASTEKVETFSDDEKSALSFGAVYHPWLMNRNESFEVVKNIPPSGAVSGVFAKRSLTRGAWVAPANENLQNVLGLANEFRRENYLDIQDGSINLIRHEPTGFVVLDSDTLSDDLDLRQITVRRLLSLLRRLAAKHGAEYVFEPNDERFRRSVQRGFNSLLDKMFVRGAFAGTTPSTAYQVVVSEKLNNVQSTEQGRFIVELRVAPSLPLKFVTVRLINSGGRSAVSETV